MLNEYLNKLKELLDSNNIADKDSFIEYFEEMINDRLDAGQSEVDILNNLEDPALVVENIKKEIGQKNSQTKKEEFKDDAEEKVYEFDNVDELHIEVVTAKVDVYTSDTDKTIVKVIDGKDYIEVEDKNGKLHIEEKTLNSINVGWPFFKNDNDSFFRRRNIQIVIEMPIKNYHIFDFENVSGSLDLSNINFEKVSLETVSGSLNINNASFYKTELEAVSGNIKLSDIISKHSFKVELVSGNVKVDKLESDYIDVEAVSGNIDLTINGNKQDYCVDIEKVFKTEHFNEGGNKKLKIESVSGRINYQFIN